MLHRPNRRSRAVIAMTAAAAVLAGLITVLTPGTAQAAAPVGFYSSTPQAGATTDVRTFSFDASTSLVPDTLINPPKVDWGDGTSDVLDPWCLKWETGEHVAAENCAVEIPNFPAAVPLGVYHISGSHNYARPGTYHPKLTYGSWLVPYSISWTVRSPGTVVPLTIDYDDKAFQIALNPTPAGGTDGHYFSYVPGTQVTVTVTPKPGYDVANWTRSVCSLTCWRSYEPPLTNDICGHGSRSCTFLTTQVGNGYYQEISDPGVAMLSIGNQPGNLIANPSFEQPDVASNDYRMFSSIPGWSGARAIEVHDHVATGGDPAHDGTQYVEMDSDGPNTIWQDIPTVAGKKYQISLAFSARPGTGYADNKVGVYFGGKSLGWTTRDGTNRRVNTWYTVTFGPATAGTGTTSQIKIEDQGTNNGLGGYIDSVKVVAVN